eukprot:7292842-Ditylum_brightwellii.AAC.1
MRKIKLTMNGIHNMAKGVEMGSDRERTGPIYQTNSGNMMLPCPRWDLMLACTPQPRTQSIIRTMKKHKVLKMIQSTIPS